VSTTNRHKLNHGEDLGPPPTDLELMLYVDGELDEARCGQVEAYVLRDPDCRAKVTGLEVAGRVVRDGALSSNLADGIADAVMARIAKGDMGSSNGAVLQLRSASELSGQLDVPSKPQAQLRQAPANDNARGISALAALGVAAAAALMIWTRAEVEPPRAASTVPASTEAVIASSPSSADSALAAVAEGEVEPGVEVAAVDFGARMGTIFYVPQGSAASSPTTTVVWLADEGLGGQ
jgi:anti-sigma factor RsiW